MENVKRMQLWAIFMKYITFKQEIGMTSSNSAQVYSFGRLFPFKKNQS